jgi:hypothetical protein
MSIMHFRMLWNVASGKVVTVGGDGLLRQYASNIHNLRQHWLMSFQFGPAETVKFRCRASGLLIDAQGGVLREHTVLQQFPHTGNANQRWRLSFAGDDRYFIHADNTQLVWDMPGSSSTDGTIIQLYPFNGGSNQQWRLRGVETVEAWQITSLRSGLMLDVPGYSQRDGESIQQSADNTVDRVRGFNQLWELLEDRFGRTKIRSVCSRKLLDYPLQSAQQRAPAFLSQYDDNGGSNQLWYAEPVFGPPVNIVSLVNGFRVDIPNGSLISGTRVQAAPHNGGGRNQLWQIV